MNNEVTKEDKTIYITEQDPAAEYVTIAEYIRKRHELDLKKDEQARPLWANSINKVIQDGYIEVFIQGKNKFIDWNKYKNWVFKRSFQMPISKKNERK